MLEFCLNYGLKRVFMFYKMYIVSIYMIIVNIIIMYIYLWYKLRDDCLNYIFYKF